MNSFDTVLAVLHIFSWFMPSVIVFWISRFCENPTSKRVLQMLALGVAGYLLVLFAFLAAAALTCSGNAIYGYGDCSLMPDKLANLSVLTFIVSIIGLIVIGLISLTFAGFAEFLFRRKAR